MKFDKLPAWSQSESRTLDLLGAGKVRPDDLQALRGGVCLRTEMKQFAVVPHDDTEVGAAQHPRTLGDGIEVQSLREALLKIADPGVLTLL